MHISVYYILLIANSVKSQISVFTSDNGSPQELDVPLEPALVSLNLLNTTNSEDAATTESSTLSNSLLNSAELTQGEITSNTLENENVAHLEENSTEIKESSAATKANNFTSNIAESGPLVTQPASSTESISTHAETNLINNESVPTITAAAIPVSSSSIAVSLPTSTNIPSQSTTTILPMIITTLQDVSGVSTLSSSSNVTQSSSLTTEILSTTTEPSSFSKETTKTSVSYPNIPKSSFSTSSTIESTKSTTAIPPTSTTTKTQSSSTPSPSLCGENEIYSCLPLCPRTCNNPLSRVLCRPVPSYISICLRGCTCMTGYLFEKTISKCVKKCPATQSLHGHRV